MGVHFAVAIDGPTAAGKSTLAKAIAEKYGFSYVDTGAIYRTVGLAALKAGLNTENAVEISALLPTWDISVRYDDTGRQRMRLNGTDVSANIRSPQCAMYASSVARLPAVRDYLMATQRNLAKAHDVVMDGRDIGTVVLPDADVKIFLTASAEIRAERRYREQRERGETQSYDAVLEELRIRDDQDMTRSTAPLRPADDAVLLDNGALSFSESVEAVCRLIDAKKPKKI